MSISTRIDTYLVHYPGGGQMKRIELLNIGGDVGTLLFVPLGVTFPSDVLSDGKPQVHFSISDFANCLDMLRNEKPCYLYWVGAGTNKGNALKTGLEAAGEGEA